MIRKKHIFALIFILVIGVNLFVLSNYYSSTYQNKSVFGAVSKRTTSFLYTENLAKTSQKLKAFKYLNVLNQSTALKALSTQVFRTDSILEILSIETNLKNPKTIIAANHIGSNTLDFISLVEYAEKFPVKKLNSYLKKNNFSLNEYKYQDVLILSIKNFLDQKKYSFAVFNNILIGSSSSPLVEEALNTLLKNEGKNADIHFNSLKLTAKKAVDGFLFIDHQNSQDLASVLLTPQFLKANSEQEDALEWSAYALNIDTTTINYKTQFFAKNWNQTCFKNLLNAQAVPFSFEHILPNNTAYFEAQSSKNNIGFQNNDVSYSYFKDWLDQEAIFFTLETLDEDFQKRSGLILKANHTDTAKIKLYLLNKEMAPVFNYEGQAIYEMNLNVLSNIVQSDFIKLQKPYFAFIGNYVVFANDMNVIRTFIQKNKEKKTLANSKNYTYTVDSLASKVVYFNPQYFTAALGSVFKENIFPMQLGNVFTSYSVVNNEIIAKGSIHFDPEEKKRTQSIWDVVLDTVSYFKPQIVIHADNLRKEILVQDTKNTIYLISQSGDMLLKKAFKEQILSDVYQIDLYKANKLFYVFNTKNHIYALKRDGSLVDGYPIKLPTEATNKLLVVNYDKAKKYRFFIACNNEKIYAYEANGKPLEGWSPLGSFGKTSTAIKHTTFGGRDYIFFTTDKGNFYALDRKGNKRFESISLETPFVEAFESTDKGFVGFSNGSAFKIDLTGKVSAKILGDSTYKTFTNYLEKNAYAIASQNQIRIAKSKWTILGKRALNDEILNIEKLSIRGKTWFLVNASRSVYLLNEMGEIHPDFPMLANSYARISKFYENKNELLLFIEGNKLKTFDLYFPN